MTWNMFFREKYKLLVKPYVLRLIAVSLKVRLIRRAVKVRRHEAMWAVELNECQGTPWSEEVDSKKLHGALSSEYDLEPRESAFFHVRRQQEPHNLSDHLFFFFFFSFISLTADVPQRCHPACGH